MVTFPKAKINIGLTIVRKRDDGFHDIETIFYPAGLSDALEFVVSEAGLGPDELTVTGVAAGCRPEENLVIKAVNLLRAKYKIPFLRIHLHKVIPPGSGLGGGSSDASAMLMLLNRTFKLQIGRQELEDMALKLGSDCPFFIQGSPVLATGRGEVFTSLPCFLDGYYLVIVRENIHISTPLAYANSKPHGKTSGLEELIKAPLEEWKNNIKNDFEEYAFREHPRLELLKQGLYDSGALYSSMSGSGSAIYGIFRTKPESPPPGNIIWQGWPKLFLNENTE
ncbi:MAG: 4-(cytidine 5'-diphospho)-2-C-methyl-D-erythritol kinase [Bacteroidales bacterium]